MTLLSNLDLPNLPTRFGSEYNDCWGFRHSNGTEIAILGGIEDIFFVNITNPANPVIILQYHVTNLPTGTANQSLWRDFKTYGNYAYAAADEGTSGLLVFDLSQVPASVTMVYQSTTFWNRTHNIYIDEPNGRLYAAGSNTVSNGLVILDLASNPASPTLLANLPLTSYGGGYVHDVHVRNHIAYCSHGNLSKLQIYNLSNLSNVTVVGTLDNYPEPGYNHSSWLNPATNMLAMCDETHGSDVKVVNVSDPANISLDDYHTFYSELLGPGAPGSSIAHNPFILGNYVYVAYYHDGVQVFDISNPGNIVCIAYYDTYPDNVDYNGYNGCWGVYPFLPSGHIIASDQNHGLYVLQVTSFPLDIRFLSFEASRATEGILLEWTVADAADGNQFDILRSADGGLTFYSVDQLALQESTGHYDFIDRNVYENKPYLYRVDFIEQDGKRISSPLRSVRAMDKPGQITMVNPLSETLVLKVPEPLTSLDIRLYDIHGKRVWAVSRSESAPVMAFPVGDLPPATYLLTIRWTGGEMNALVQKI